MSRADKGGQEGTSGAGTVEVIDLAPDWEYVSDGVMGGVSSGGLNFQSVCGRDAQRLTGRISLENNGGFIQMAFDLESAGEGIDPSEWDGIEFDHRGNGESYDLRLRTEDLTQPWQSFRSAFGTLDTWRTARLPFEGFEAHRTRSRFDKARLRRLGIVAVGRAFRVDIAVARIALYRRL